MNFNLSVRFISFIQRAHARSEQINRRGPMHRLNNLRTSAISTILQLSLLAIDCCLAKKGV